MIQKFLQAARRTTTRLAPHLAKRFSTGSNNTHYNPNHITGIVIAGPIVAAVVAVAAANKMQIDDAEKQIDPDKVPNVGTLIRQMASIDGVDCLTEKEFKAAEYLQKKLEKETGKRPFIMDILIHNIEKISSGRFTPDNVKKWKEEALKEQALLRVKSAYRFDYAKQLNTTKWMFNARIPEDTLDAAIAVANISDLTVRLASQSENSPSIAVKKGVADSVSLVNILLGEPNKRTELVKNPENLVDNLLLALEVVAKDNPNELKTEGFTKSDRYRNALKTLVKEARQKAPKIKGTSMEEAMLGYC